MNKEKVNSLIKSLTKIEADTLKMFLSGDSIEEISESRRVSQSTIKSAVKNIRHKYKTCGLVLPSRVTKRSSSLLHSHD